MTWEGRVAISRRTVAGVPALVAAPAPDGGRWPLVLWLHGFRAGKDAHLPELTRVAVAGFLAVGLDAVGHGERAAPDLPARMAAAPGGALEVMQELAAATAAELPAVIDALVREGLADPERVALVGISMGGYLVYQAAARHVTPRAVVALLGSPEWPGPDSPHRRPEAFRDVALLSITAGADVNVPPEAARRFHAALGASHPDPSRVAYHELADAPHLMNGEQWAEAMDATLDWLDRHAR